MDDIIQVKNVTKRFKKFVALNNVTVSFEKGKIHGLIGRNGSGKTVLMKVILGLMKPSDGEIIVEGKKVGKDIETPENIGAIIETPGFLDNYSGYMNLKFLADIKRIAGKNEIRETIKLVGLEPDDKKHVGKYSLGMRQRLAIAQAVMEKQEILMLDEPMNGLDKSGVEQIRKILKKLKNQGKTIIIASHNSEDIAELCDTVYEMDMGVITKIR